MSSVPEGAKPRFSGSRPHYRDDAFGEQEIDALHHLVIDDVSPHFIRLSSFSSLLYTSPVQPPLSFALFNVSSLRCNAFQACQQNMADSGEIVNRKLDN